jgi:hypothetical protein
LVSGVAASATTPSLVALGNHSPVHPMQTTEFSDDPLKALQPLTWHSSHSKPLWTMNVHWLLEKYLKKSEPPTNGEHREIDLETHPTGPIK